MAYRRQPPNACMIAGLVCTTLGMLAFVAAVRLMLWAGFLWLVTGTWAPVRVAHVLETTLSIDPLSYGRITWVGLRSIVEGVAGLSLFSALPLLVPLLFALGWTLDKIGGWQDRQDASRRPMR